MDHSNAHMNVTSTDHNDRRVNVVIIYVHVLVRTAQAEMGGYVDNLCNTAQISITHTLKSNTKSVIPLCLLKTKILLVNLTGNV